MPANLLTQAPPGAASCTAGEAPVSSVCPALRPFPAQIWEFSGLEGKSLERNVRKTTPDPLGERRRKVRSESEEGREAVEDALLCRVEHRRPGDWKTGGEAQTEGGGGEAAQWASGVCVFRACVCVCARAPARARVCLAPVQRNFP